MKKETLEEAAREYYKRGQLGFEAAADTEKAFIKGAKWQAEQNKEYIHKLLDIIQWYDNNSTVRPDLETFEWYEQFKKKA